VAINPFTPAVMASESVIFVVFFLYNEANIQHRAK